MRYLLILIGIVSLFEVISSSTQNENVERYGIGKDEVVFLQNCSFMDILL